MSTDAIVLLKEDHKEIRRLFRELQSATTKSSKNAAARRVVKALTTYSYVENEYVHPELRERVPEVEDDVLRSYEENHVAEVLCAELAVMAPDDERFDAKAAVLFEAVSRHFDNEEKDWFRQVRQSMGRKELQEIGAQMIKLRKKAPRRPPQPLAPIVTDNGQQGTPTKQDTSTKKSKPAKQDTAKRDVAAKQNTAKQAKQNAAKRDEPAKQDKPAKRNTSAKQDKPAKQNAAKQDTATKQGAAKQVVAAEQDKPAKQNAAKQDTAAKQDRSAKRDTSAKQDKPAKQNAAKQKAAAKQDVVTEQDVAEQDTSAERDLVEQDVVDLLIDQHTQIRDLFLEVESATGKARTEAFQRLVHLLAVHETAEEQVVHPLTRLHVEGGADIVGDRLAEEHAAKETLAELEKMGPEAAEFPGLLNQLRLDVLDHASAEEAYEFRYLRRSVPAGELRAMAAAVRAAEAVAPTHPHPGVESATANTVAGPALSLFDRTKDLVRDAIGTSG